MEYELTFSHFVIVVLVTHTKQNYLCHYGVSLLPHPFVIAELVLLGETNEMQSNLRERSTAIHSYEVTKNNSIMIGGKKLTVHTSQRRSIKSNN
ncbi:MAG: hypothetical protein LBG48_04365 [Rickettsiales bacterium]|nr:hypothetical protein [Rickettsiales bacterium]